MVDRERVAAEHRKKAVHMREAAQWMFCSRIRQGLLMLAQEQERMAEAALRPHIGGLQGSRGMQGTQDLSPQQPRDPRHLGFHHSI